MKNRLLCAGSSLALALAWPALAAAQDNTLQEVVVTGSFIRGTPEDAALPVDVISADELKKRGSPSTLEMVKALTVSNGVLGETNQGDGRSQGTEGVVTINLRGLGAARTLVLFNGRRMVNSPTGGGGAPDLAFLPTPAIGRLEVLKDGAAATYGSDAIGGVVNFITRKDLDGLEVSGSYRVVDGSDGDYDGSIAWGWIGERANVLLTASYQHRSELPVRERDFTNKGYLASPEGGWSSGGNPSSFLPLTTTPGGAYVPMAGLQRDSGCAALGGFPGFSGGLTTPVCYWNTTTLNNLVELENHYQLYGELNVDLTDTTELHVEALFARTDVPEWSTSASFLGLQSPTAATNPAATSGFGAGYFVPSTNPGFAAYQAANPTQLPAGATGAYFPGSLFRPLGLGGNPLFPGNTSQGSRTHEAYRVAASLKGEFANGIGWDVAGTYMAHNFVRTTYDSVVSRVQLGLRGLGGPSCNPATGTPGAGGCLWLNPFSNAVATSSHTGAANPGYVASVANSREMLRWFFQPTTGELTSRIFVADLVFNGETSITLPGGAVAWAAGGQFRRTGLESKYDAFANLLTTPCIDTVVNGSTNCAVRNGPMMFLGGFTPVDLEGDVRAVFAELSLPVTDSFQAQLAARFEDYGDKGGSTFDPKLSLRWQISDMFALRGSVGTTFRAPALVNLDPSAATVLQFLGGAFRATDIFGNPNLEPESATTYSVGAIVKAGGLRATVDYWSFDFENPIVGEPVGGIFSSLFPTGSGVGNCGDPAFAALQRRFTFQGACSVNNLARIRTDIINGPGIKTSGIDALVDYAISDVWGGELSFGGSLSYVLEFAIDATTVEGVVVARPFDAVGHLNFQTQSIPIPQWKGQAFAEYTSGPHNVRLTLNYIDSYTDRRTSPFPPSTLFLPDGSRVPASSAGQSIDSSLTADVSYRVFLPWQTTATFTVTNLTNQDPPYVRLDLGYDPFTGNPLGRTYKLSLTKKF